MTDERHRGALGAVNKFVYELNGERHQQGG